MPRPKKGTEITMPKETAALLSSIGSLIHQRNQNTLRESLKMVRMELYLTDGLDISNYRKPEDWKELGTIFEKIKTVIEKTPSMTRLEDISLPVSNDDNSSVTFTQAESERWNGLKKWMLEVIIPRDIKEEKLKPPPTQPTNNNSPVAKKDSTALEIINKTVASIAETLGIKSRFVAMKQAHQEMKAEGKKLDSPEAVKKDKPNSPAPH